MWTDDDFKGHIYIWSCHYCKGKQCAFRTNNIEDKPTLCPVTGKCNWLLVVSL